MSQPDNQPSIDTSSQSADQSVDAEVQLRIDAVLQQMQIAGECMGVITEILFILNGKRETLEEKTIKSIFHQLSIAVCRYLSTLHGICLSRTLPQSPPFPGEEKIESAANLFEEIRLSVSELLKIARYDLNFLEQYFEYDYCARLHDESRFVERVEALRNEFEA